MIRNETVLVLGAGASMPYGFPSGKQLRELLVQAPLFAPAIQKEWFSADAAKKFCTIFLQSGLQSIDAFLSRRGSDTLENGVTIERIGKIGISLALRAGKSGDHLFHYPHLSSAFNLDRTDNWYQYLWHHLTQGVTSTNLDFFKSNRLTVVTFNYDLSLEHFLFCAMRNAYGIPEDRAAEMLSGIKFVHLYGKLSGNPFADSFNYDFDFDRDFRLVERDCHSIEVIDERRTNSASGFNESITALETAERICFLGFGFDSTNVERLKIPEVLINRAVAHQSTQPNPITWPILAATTLGFEDAERNALVQKLVGPLHSANLGYQVSMIWAPQIGKVFGNDGNCKSEMLLRRTQILT